MDTAKRLDSPRFGESSDTAKRLVSPCFGDSSDTGKWLVSPRFSFFRLVVSFSLALSSCFDCFSTLLSFSVMFLLFKVLLLCLKNALTKGKKSYFK